jgi:hypothetical protein
VRSDRAGGELAGQVLTGLRERAAAAGLDWVIVPVRLVEIDRERDLGTYQQTNLWLRHR